MSAGFLLGLLKVIGMMPLALRLSLDVMVTIVTLINALTSNVYLAKIIAAIKWLLFL